jgi:hypothetical protein
MSPCFSENWSGPNGVCVGGTKMTNQQREPNEESDRGQNTGDTSYARRTKSVGRTNLLREKRVNSVTKSFFFTEKQHEYNRFTEVTALPPSFLIKN